MRLLTALLAGIAGIAGIFLSSPALLGLATIVVIGLLIVIASCGGAKVGDQQLEIQRLEDAWQLDMGFDPERLSS